jgi:transcriptional/translational regulatory protein YebC/TACO1
VAFQFLHSGQFLVQKGGASEDTLMEVALEAGADDVITTEDGFEIRCDIHAFDRVSHALEGRGIKPASAEIAYIPTSLMPVADVDVARSLVKFHEALEELDDVQQVFSNEEMDEAVSAAAHA